MVGNNFVTQRKYTDYASKRHGKTSNLEVKIHMVLNNSTL